MLEPTLWPPILAMRAPGSRSAAHSHHAMHILVCLVGELRVRGVGASARVPPSSLRPARHRMARR